MKILKTILASLLLLIGGCSRTEETSEDYAIRDTAVIRVDGCEYIVNGILNNGAAIIHKQNCDNHNYPESLEQ